MPTSNDPWWERMWRVIEPRTYRRPGPNNDGPPIFSREGRDQIRQNPGLLANMTPAGQVGGMLLNGARGLFASGPSVSGGGQVGAGAQPIGVSGGGSVGAGVDAADHTRRPGLAGNSVGAVRGILSMPGAGMGDAIGFLHRTRLHDTNDS